ncbi:MAG: hypothetical protein R2828_18240 [Saprospiraceae bacterium]
MRAITLETQDNNYLIRIDKNSIDKDFLFNLIEKLRLEFLAQEVDFDEDIEELGKEIKSNWWKENKEKYLG